MIDRSRITASGVESPFPGRRAQTAAVPARFAGIVVANWRRGLRRNAAQGVPRSGAPATEPGAPTEPTATEPTYTTVFAVPKYSVVGSPGHRCQRASEQATARRIRLCR
jgi:hypothetical protein